MIALIATALAAETEDGVADQTVREIAAVKDAWSASIETWLSDAAPFLLTEILGSGIWRFGAALVTVAIFAVLGALLMRLSMVVARRVAKKTQTEVDDALVEAINPPLFYLVLATGVYLAFFWPNFPSALDTLIDVVYRLVAIVIVGWAVLRCADILTTVLKDLASHTESELDDYLVPLVSRILRVTIIALTIVFCVQELGYNVAGLLAGLGVGGLAFALAAQDTVSNWFGALMIYTDRPFLVGDWVKTSELEGVVEEIGLRSTKVRTFSKTVVSVPNNKLATDVVENYSAMPRRRISFTLGVTYSTTPDMMRALVRRVQDHLRTHPAMDQSFWIVKFNDFGDSSLNVMIYCFTKTTDWAEYMAIRQELNLTIMDIMAELGIEAAFPSRSVYMEEPDAEALRELDDKARAWLEAAGPGRGDGGAGTGEEEG